ncbi:DUF1254 domain-containing protein [Nocardia sp. NBC_01730]|uniref:DUF1254 domain-containing protein n=1 Tax=Nocardia sp. NBC_01730 TaxID=2975998 RepID=UPI002E0EE530|nr:DUF1254 domain-containing protein [Nocardia sp. NBC_01730]
MDDRTENRPVVSRRAVLGMAVTSVAAIGVAACGGSDEDGSTARTGTGEAATIAKDAYIFGYPLVLMDFTRAADGATAPANRFQHASALPTPAQRDVVRPDLDTLHSTAWLDLTGEPIVLRVPEMGGGRYWLVQLLDAWTNNVHNPSSLRPQAKSATPPYTYVVTGPGWSGVLPDGLTPMPMPTPTVWLTCRIQVGGNNDIRVVHELQQELQLMPLSAWFAGTGPSAPAGPPSRWTEAQPLAEQVAKMGARDFFHRMCAVMSINPPAPDDAPAMRRFATIGIRPGGKVKGISDSELTAAADTAKEQIPVSLGARTVNENGWVFDPDIGRYGTNYLLRAVIAWIGLGATLPEDSIFPTLFATADAAGSTGRFGLHFAPGQLPPVNAFWSLTAYGADSYLVPNPAEIYAIGHHAPVVFNADGSLDLTLQHNDPGPSILRGNWLPIPEAGQFSVSLAMFAPKEEALHGRWLPPRLLPLP